VVAGDAESVDGGAPVCGRSSDVVGEGEAVVEDLAPAR
jgi:hypothetical protein